MDANTNPIELCGTVTAVIYQNEENGYAVLKLDVDDDPRAAYFDQVHNGVYIRMAIILALLGIPDPLTGKKVLQR